MKWRWRSHSSFFFPNTFVMVGMFALSWHFYFNFYHWRIDQRQLVRFQLDEKPVIIKIITIIIRNRSGWLASVAVQCLFSSFVFKNSPVISFLSHLYFCWCVCISWHCANAKKNFRVSLVGILKYEYLTVVFYRCVLNLIAFVARLRIMAEDRKRKKTWKKPLTYQRLPTLLVSICYKK